ncbi:DNA-dependent RNA polymerase auxiliary subunit epsilon [Staphylococcus hominis]
MNIYKLFYQHHKDIVDDNILTVFVLAKSEEDVRKFAKVVNYKIEDIKQTTYEDYEEAKAKGETYRLEHADTYID